MWDLNDLEHDAFFALSGTSEFDAFIALLHLDETCLTAGDLGEYDYAFFGTNGGDIITGVEDMSGVIAGGNGKDTLHGGDGSDKLAGGEGADRAVRCCPAVYGLSSRPAGLEFAQGEKHVRLVEMGQAG